MLALAYEYLSALWAPPGGGRHERCSRLVQESQDERDVRRSDKLLCGRAFTDAFLGHVGGGLEYRFTPHIGLFGEIAYVFPDLSRNNFIQTNFGLRWAF